MALQHNFQLLGQYNQWMNDGLYRVVATLNAEDLALPRGAFFGSILGTLNHLFVADTIWLKRFSLHPAKFKSLDHVRAIPMPSSVADTPYTDLSELRSARQQMDEAIVGFVNEATEEDYAHNLAYQNTKGLPFCKLFSELVQHLFNHQTHHRGQLTVLLSQIDRDYGSTDLLALLPEAEPV